MNRIMNFVGRQMGRLGRWIFGTRNGWIFFAIVTIVTMAKFQPALLERLVSETCAIILNGLIRAVETNQNTLSLLFLIAMTIFGGWIILRGLFGRKRSSGKK